MALDKSDLQALEGIISKQLDIELDPIKLILKSMKEDIKKLRVSSWTDMHTEKMHCQSFLFDK